MTASTAQKPPIPFHSWNELIDTLSPASLHFLLQAVPATDVSVTALTMGDYADLLGRELIEPISADKPHDTRLTFRGEFVRSEIRRRISDARRFLAKIDQK
jgi:hypothetical protein